MAGKLPATGEVFLGRLFGRRCFLGGARLAQADCGARISRQKAGNHRLHELFYGVWHHVAVYPFAGRWNSMRPVQWVQAGSQGRVAHRRPVPVTKPRGPAVVGVINVLGAGFLGHLAQIGASPVAQLPSVARRVWCRGTAVRQPLVNSPRRSSRRVASQPLSPTWPATVRSRTTC
jgi:hypothetical protein